MRVRTETFPDDVFSKPPFSKCVLCISVCPSKADIGENRLRKSAQGVCVHLEYSLLSCYLDYSILWYYLDYSILRYYLDYSILHYYLNYSSVLSYRLDYSILSYYIDYRVLSYHLDCSSKRYIAKKGGPIYVVGFRENRQKTPFVL